MATVSISTTPVTQNFPAGTVQGLWRFDIGGEPKTSSDPTMTFEDVGPGDYVATVAALDGDGNVLGSAMSANFSIVAPEVSLNVAGTVSVAVQV